MGEVTWFSPSGWLIGLSTIIYQHYARLKQPDFANSINVGIGPSWGLRWLGAMGSASRGQGGLVRAQLLL